ncbi:MAG: hypothetical protein ACTSRA_20080, partial [Promethearchaeota archaeon]
DIDNAKIQIQNKIKETGFSQSFNLNRLSNIFSCSASLKVPEKLIAEDRFVCPKCEHDYNGLKILETSVANQLQNILEKIEKGQQTEPYSPKDRNVEKGDIGVIKKPTQEEKESWEKYKILHREIENIFKDIDIYSQGNLYKNDKEIISKIKNLIKDTRKRYPSFKPGHSCSIEPQRWDIMTQACTSCKYNYEKLVDMNATISTAYNQFIEEIKEIQERMLFQEFELIVDTNDEKTNMKIEDKIRSINTILLTYRKVNPEKNQKVKIKIIIEKMD